MLYTNFIYTTVAEVSKGDYAIFLAFIGIIINFFALRQSIIKNRREHEERYVTKEQLNEKLKIVDVQLTLIDKDACKDRENNIREHDSIKKDIDSKLDSINKTVDKIFHLVTERLGK